MDLLFGEYQNKPKADPGKARVIFIRVDHRQIFCSGKHEFLIGEVHIPSLFQYVSLCLVHNEHYPGLLVWARCIKGPSVALLLWDPWYIQPLVYLELKMSLFLIIHKGAASTTNRKWLSVREMWAALPQSKMASSVHLMYTESEVKKLDKWKQMPSRTRP